MRTDLAVRLPATLELALLAMGAVIVFSFVASYVAVMHPTSMVGRLIRIYAKTARAIPEFVVGLALIFIFYAELHWAPAPLGRIDPLLAQPSPITNFPLLDSVLRGDWPVVISMTKHLVLPITVEVIAQSAVMIRLLISGLEEHRSGSDALSDRIGRIAPDGHPEHVPAGAASHRHDDGHAVWLSPRWRGHS